MRKLAAALAFVAVAAVACASNETGDAEVELNTALGRRGTPSSTTTAQITTTTTGAQVSATTAAVPITSPSTTTAPPTTTEAPCQALETASVVTEDEVWRLEGRAGDGTPVSSPDYPLAEGLGSVIGQWDFDLDGRREYVVVLMEPELSRLMVLEFRDCALVEPRDALTGEPLRPVVGSYSDTLGRVTCLDDGLEIATLQATFDDAPPADPDTSAPDVSEPARSLSGWVGTVDEVSLFAGSWEVRSSSELSLEPGAEAGWNSLGC